MGSLVFCLLQLLQKKIVDDKKKKAQHMTLADFVNNNFENWDEEACLSENESVKKMQ